MLFSSVDVVSARNTQVINVDDGNPSGWMDVYKADEHSCLTQLLNTHRLTHIEATCIPKEV